MNWALIKSWARANILTAVVIFIVTPLLLLYIIFGGKSPNSDIPGGGFWTLVLAGLVFFGAHKAGEGKLRVVLGIIATVLLVVAIWPKIFPLINFLGLAPNIIMILAILVGIWMVKGGKGFFAWRMLLLIFLVLCWIGANGKLFKDGFTAFLSSTGIEMKIPDIKIETPKAVKGLTSHLGRVVDQQVSQSRERWVKKDAKLYKYNGTFSPNAVVDTDSIKVFLLGEQIEKDGLTFEKVRIGDPATGEDAWVYSGILLTSPTASAPKADPTGKSSSWQKVEKKVVDFSRVEVLSITPEQHIATIPLPVSIGSGNYRIKLQGSYDFFLGGRWIEFPWQGNDRLVAFPDKKEFSELQNGAVVILKGGENITPMSEDGAVVNLSGKIDKMTIKINTFFKNKGEYIHPSGGFILRNSENKPLKIIIEKEV